MLSILEMENVRKAMLIMKHTKKKCSQVLRGDTSSLLSGVTPERRPSLSLRLSGIETI